MPPKEYWDDEPYTDEDGGDDGDQLPTVERQVVDAGYSDRARGDFVVSGPLPGGVGPGRAFSSPQAAYLWARRKYGDRVKLLPESLIPGAYRWAVMVKHAQD